PREIVPRDGADGTVRLAEADVVNRRHLACFQHLDARPKPGTGLPAQRGFLPAHDSTEEHLRLLCLRVRIEGVKQATRDGRPIARRVPSSTAVRGRTRFVTEIFREWRVTGPVTRHSPLVTPRRYGTT